MLGAIPIDYDWTIFLRQNRIKALDGFMDRTIFEGEAPGGGDPIILFFLVTVVAYYIAWKRGSRSRLYAWRPHLGFILTFALTGSFMMVHSLKWVMGRARPAYVVKELLPYSDWFLFGPHYITEGTYRGSFPSGHVAQAFALMTIAYILTTAFKRSRNPRLLGWLWGFAALGYTLMMGVSRCMKLSHWLSDVTGALGLAWIIMHVTYFWLLKIPRQEAFYDRHGYYPQNPRVWELSLCFHIFGIVVGVLAMILGVRGIFLHAPLPLLALIPAGLVLVIFFLIKFRSLYDRVFLAYDDQTTLT
jgi:membrane-associated phospholipid phosphatase